MNHTPRPTLVTTPPPYKTALSTTVDAFTPSAYDLLLTSKLGKRRLFRHRAWANSSAFPGWTQIFITPGWIESTPAGNHKVVGMAICPDGEVEAKLADLEEKCCVHLWQAPINFPHTPKSGNNFRPDASLYSGSHILRASRLSWRGVLKAVAA